MGCPITHHQHLHGDRSVAGDRKEWARGRWDARRLLVTAAHRNYAIFDCDRLIDRHGAGGSAFDVERLRSPVLSGAKRGGQGYGTPTVSEFEIDFRRK